MTPEYKDLIGAPFVLFGRSVAEDGGISCQGLVLEMHRRAGHNAIDPLDDEDAAEACWRVVEGHPQPMDVIGLQVGKTDLAGHVALMLDDDKVLHATEDKGVIVSDYKNIFHRVLMVYRWRS